MKVPGSESSWERKFHLWNFRSWKRKYVETKVPVTRCICSIIWCKRHSFTFINIQGYNHSSHHL